MSNAKVIARVLESGQLECRIVPGKGEELVLTGSPAELEPSMDGPSSLSGNRALVDNAWAFAKFTYLKVSLPTEAEQKSAEKRAGVHRQVAAWIAELAADIERTTKGGWCSACFTDCDHRKVRNPPGPLPAYLCVNCGSPTLPCAAPSCDNMATRGHGALRTPRYCAEHRHEIPGFEKASLKMESLDDYRAFLEFEKPNLSRTTKLVGAGLVTLATGGLAAYAAAPAIGGAIGSMASTYTGAAASSYGLALLGGGSISAGGFGMAGGAYVVAAMGGTLGSALGASVTNAYVRDDSSFMIEKLQDGPGVPVVVSSGFLNENDSGWGGWRDIVTRRYPDSPVYRVHWGSKELKDLAMLAGGGAAKVAGPAALKKAALKATKAGAKKLAPLAPVLAVSSLAKNPWTVAKERANKTGAILADLLARTTVESYVLIGHSLGARVMVMATESLGTKSDGPRLQSVHLLGAAVAADDDWLTLTARVDDAVYNYHSANDGTLKYLYTIGQLGQTAAGVNGFSPASGKLRNIDVSGQVDGHLDYLSNVVLL